MNENNLNFIIHYRFCFRKTPFKIIESDTPENLLSRISQTKINFDEGNWKHISHDAKDLVKRMLNLDPRQRISSSNILKHPWITNSESLPDIKLAIQDGDNVKVKQAFELCLIIQRYFGRLAQLFFEISRRQVNHFEDERKRNL